jgi:four helix bundle protein
VRDEGKDYGKDKGASMNNQYFPHEKLDVYSQCLAFARQAASLVDHWPASASVRDQLDRASESHITNLARAVQARGTAKGIYFLECSLGSVLECAACLDVGAVKHLLTDAEMRSGKEQLQSIARMEVGLRRSWLPAVHEQDTTPYGSNSGGYFAHESLHVYQRALQLFEELEENCLAQENGRLRHLRRIDDCATGLVLNIAEGNGRFSHLDHGKFIDIAEESGIKLAAYLDLVDVSCTTDIQSSKRLLREVMAMLSGLKGYLDGEGKD